MAISTEGSTGNASVTTEVPRDGKEEVPALLGSEILDNKPEIVPDQASAGEDNAPADGVKAGDGEHTDSFHDLPDNRQILETSIEPVNTSAEHSAALELKSILKSLQDTLADTHSISTKIDAVSSNTDALMKQVNSISNNGVLLAAEMELISSGVNAKDILSKTFMVLSSLIIAVLVVFQMYMFSSLAKTQRLQNAAGSSVLENISGLNKKMVEYDKNLSKALEHSTSQEPQLNPPVASKTGYETGGNTEVGSATVPPVLEKLNKLRNGLPEKKLIRKESGDWFVYNKKSEECISDVDVIEALNQAYKKIGRTLSPIIPLPQHKAVCILKPDGKGATQVVMTKDFLP